MKPYKSLLEPVKWEYKGAIEARAAIRAKADKNPRVQALADSLQRGKELSCVK